ncbi:MAG: hypothetical protein R3F55_04980 [Alphaproteobacteria bacterium]
MAAGELTALVLSGLGCAALLGVLGVRMLRGFVLAMEGHREFHGDSLTKRSRLGGFVRFFLWALGGAVTWSFYIDWLWFEDFGYAFSALMVRLEIVFRILAELSDD